MATQYGTQERRDEETPLIAGDSSSETCWQKTRGAVRRHWRRILSTWLIIMAVTAVLTLSFHFSLRRPKHPVDNTAADLQCISDRSWFVSLMLSIFLGEFGVDRFYLGYVFLGILKLITAGLGGIWWLVDIILISVNVLTDHDGCHLR